MLESLYAPAINKGDFICASYTPPALFEHGKAAKVARFEATIAQGLTSDMSECRWPAGFYEAVSRDPQGNKILEFSTGSGLEIGRFLAKLLEAIAEGKVRVECDYDSATDVASWAAKEDGRDVQLRKTNVGFYELEIAESRDFTGRMLKAVNLYFEQPSLAREAAKHIREGMLDIG